MFSGIFPKFSKLKHVITKDCAVLSFLLKTIGYIQEESLTAWSMLRDS